MTEKKKKIIYIIVILQNGDKVGNSEIGRKLMSIVGAVPQMEAEQVEKMMNNNMQVCLYFSILFTKRVFLVQENVSASLSL